MPNIVNLYAYIVTESEGDEALPAVSMTMNEQQVMMPLVGADLLRIGALSPYAKAIQSQLGKPMRLCRFMLIEDMETIG